MAAGLRLFLIGVSAYAAASTLGASKPLTLEAIFSRHGLTGPAPSGFAWRPDGGLVSYFLEDAASGERDLWGADPETGETRILVAADQLARLAPKLEDAVEDERERERRRRYAVADYVWSPDSQSLLFTSAGSLYLYDVAAERPRALTPQFQGVKDPKFSPSGRWVSFVHEHDLWLVAPAGGDPRRLTTGGGKDVLHGELDWSYPEELGVRSGYVWSPDSRRIAFLEMNLASMPTYPIPSLTGLRPSIDLQRYPRAGDPNARVRVGIIEAKPGRQAPRVMWSGFTAEYIPRFDWIDDRSLSVQLLNRAQDRLELAAVDSASGRRRTLLTETDGHWINVVDDLRFLSLDDGFLWTSERTGLRHIYRYGYDGELIAQLTDGDWEVKAIEGFRKSDKAIFFTANRDNPLGAGLYSVSLEGGPIRAWSERTGTTSSEMNDQADAWVSRSSTLTSPGSVRLEHPGAGTNSILHKPSALDKFRLVEPELSTLKAADGGLIRMMLLKPQELEPGKKHPLLLHVYGGPRAPTIRDAWGGRGRYLFHQFLVQQGYVVAYIDDRASSLVGHRYETALDKNYGPTALADHLTALEQLRKLDFVDPDRVGIWGWSGGGFATSFALTHSTAFKVGIAGAPVTDWRLYDSIYTERYMGRPTDQEAAYERTSAVEAAEDLHGKLLLIHGTSDDNVHIENTMRLIDSLIEAEMPYDLQLYPSQTHGVSNPKDRLHVFRAMERYLKANL